MTSQTLRSYCRTTLNVLTRNLIPEYLRKPLVAEFYRVKAAGINRTAPFAPRTAEDLLDWRKTMSYSFECSKGPYRGNSFYGAVRAFEKYANYYSSVKACIEHGVYFGNYVNKSELDESGLPCLITFGPARVRHVHDVSNVPVVPVGPYIAYAEDYLNDKEKGKLKSKLGKVLLVFPSHSVDRVSVSFEFENLCSKINQVKNSEEIDTVLISLYFKDINNGLARAYEDKGYRVVTNGYREDVLFLPRLKTLIEVSDLTMSNSVGTHVGYCAFLNTPHMVFNQEKIYKADSVIDRVEFDNIYASQVLKEKDDVATAFASFTDCLSEDQVRVCNQYWGFQDVLDRRGMCRLLEELDNAYKYKPSSRQNAFLKSYSGQKRNLGESIE